jgi:Fe-S-cluster containining protein
MVKKPSPVEALHREIDGLTEQLETHHAARLSCKRGCADCCVDGITVFEVEAERIRAHHAELLDRGEPHPPGACAFLDAEGSCRIYADRPYVCRTQGLPLRWIDEEAMVERRDICELNEEGPPITELRPGECWTIGPAESKLYALQNKSGEVRRVALRDLFSHDGG